MIYDVKHLGVKKKILTIRPNKIKVLVLRQRCPLQILADGTFLLPYRKKMATAQYFLRKQIQIYHQI
jgi:hypothetical protein